jgi:hypothetical protein
MKKKIEKYGLEFDSNDEVLFYELIQKHIEEKKPLPKEWIRYENDFLAIPVKIEREPHKLLLIDEVNYNGENISNVNTEIDFLVTVWLHDKRIRAGYNNFTKKMYVEIKGYNPFRKTQEDIYHHLIIKKYVNDNTDYVKLQYYKGNFLKLSEVEEIKKQNRKEFKKLINNYYDSLMYTIGVANKKPDGYCIDNLKEYVTNRAKFNGYKGHKETKERKKLLNLCSKHIEDYLNNKIILEVLKEKIEKIMNKTK